MLLGAWQTTTSAKPHRLVDSSLNTDMSKRSVGLAQAEWHLHTSQRRQGHQSNKRTISSSWWSEKSVEEHYSTACLVSARCNIHVTTIYTRDGVSSVSDEPLDRLMPIESGHLTYDWGIAFEKTPNSTTHPAIDTTTPWTYNFTKWLLIYL